MRAILVIAILAACGGKPSAPSLEDYKKLDAEGRCKATMPRAVQCIDNLMLDQMKAAGIGSEDAKEMMQKLASKASTREDDEKVYQIECAGEKDPNKVPDAVYACWAIDSCKAFASCVRDKLK